MEQKSLGNKDIYPMDPEDVWFECKCGIKYNDHLEEVIPEKEIVGSKAWAYSKTSDENKWDALSKARYRHLYEHLDEQELVVCDVENIGSTLTGVWKGNYETKKCKS